MDFELNTLSTAEHLLRAELVPNYSVITASVRVRIDDVINLLVVCNQKPMIQSFSRMGLFEQTPLLRSHIWKLMLESLPLGVEWREKRQQNQKVYTKLLERQGFGIEQDLLGLSQPQQSIFDKALWDQIMLDSVRTHSMLNFFQKQIKDIRIYPDKPTRHMDVLNRILYIWATVNGSVRYVQGMNELLAPLYFLEFQRVAPYSESEVFYMFTSLITPLLDMHIKDMDKSMSGINGRMIELNKHLKMVDYELWKKLQTEGIHPQFYSFRWLALMLSQQFGLYETTRLWDCLLSYDGVKRYKFLYCLCLAILKIRKHDIMKHEFTDILPRLQKLKDVDVTQVIQIGNKLYDKIIKVDIDKVLKRQEEQRQQKQHPKKTMTSKLFEAYDVVSTKTGELWNNFTNLKEKITR